MQKDVQDALQDGAYYMPMVKCALKKRIILQLELVSMHTRIACIHLSKKHCMIQCILFWKKMMLHSAGIRNMYLERELTLLTLEMKVNKITL